MLAYVQYIGNLIDNDIGLGLTKTKTVLALGDYRQPGSATRLDTIERIFHAAALLRIQP